jgi:hypothetical protein
MHNQHGQHGQQKQQEKAQEDRSGTVVLIGGSGGLSDRYRDVVAEKGLSLRHYEKRLPGGVRHTASRIALIIVIVGMVSHPLREAAQRLAERDRAPIIYLRSPSISALRGAVAGLSEPATRAASAATSA